MSLTFALDIYGTLINPLAIEQQLEQYAGDSAKPLAELWRNKQLEYSFRRGLMSQYRPFSDVTYEALRFACDSLGVDLTKHQRSAILSHYQALPAFDDVIPALRALFAKGVCLHAFSNGRSDDVAALLAHAGIDQWIESVVSVDDKQTFKPSPVVYEHFNSTVGADPEATCLVSSNPFDIIGAAACGWQTVWLRRNSSTIFDPWEFQPTHTITSLQELDALFADKFDLEGTQ